MNVSIQPKSSSGEVSQTTERSLPTIANDPNQLGFSSVLSQIVNSDRVMDSQQGIETISLKGTDATEDKKLREAFHNFVGQTFFSQMLASLRSTQEGAAYFNGGQAEKIFQGQLDQVLSEELTKSSADKIADPMFKLFQLQRSR